MPKKIAFIGAGSVTFTRNLTRDILTFPAFADCEIALMDIAQENLSYAKAAVERIVAAGKAPAKVTATLDLAAALEGANGVVITNLAPADKGGSFMIENITIGDLMIDCANAQRARDFYAALTGWEKALAYGCLAVKADMGLTILFAETDIPYAPPTWPEKPGAQQKQMHLDFTVDDLPSAVERALRLGATRPAEQYGGASYVTLLDSEGHPFCLCQRVQGDSEFAQYYEKMGYGAIPDVSINIDCERMEVLRAFYAQLTDWDQGFHETALVADNRMVVHFMGCDGDFEYLPPVWPEEPGKEQKQMHFNFQVDDLPFAVQEALRLGATKAAEQHGGGHFVTLFDPQGHPFCLCARG